MGSGASSVKIDSDQEKEIQRLAAAAQSRGLEAKVVEIGRREEDRGGEDTKHVDLDEQPTSEHRVAKEDIVELQKRFMEIDTEKKGEISIFDFLSTPELRAHPLAFRIVALSKAGSQNKSEAQRITFPEFASSLHIFSERASKEAQRAYLFRLFDIDGDLRVGYEDLYAVIGYVNLPTDAARLARVAKDVLKTFDQDRDGFLNQREFAVAAIKLGWFAMLRPVGPLLEDAEREIEQEQEYKV
eukprot:CAMPEP_0184484234 /NCGR_PEP_ID=MMETSP0113_2-20130426/5951_1 /TAXON_ID=91329 /ORGANISM="Norrisiella sphaerica, Strain BC52" /LENGTH=241 /DNA_ID=CAMNT_0026865127 /DNA_START=47 /DNA_END=772 /DNA_ORIENTATION=-